ncbi:MAG: cupredoxin family copper-binding protein [Steroidobacteraceae bacterium]
MDRGAALALALMPAAAVAFADGRAPAPRTYTVTIENMEFTPRTLAVRRHDHVVWVNKDLFPHTVTAQAKTFDSHEIVASGSWTYVAGKAGEYAYRCSLHPTMKGTLTVR